MARVLLSLASACAVANGLMFDVLPGTTKCLGEVIGKHDVVKGSFGIVDLPAGVKSGVDCKILSPSESVEYASSQDASSGKFAFTGSEPGSYRVCFTNAASTQRRVELAFSAGADALDYEGIAKKEHLKPIELELRKLEDRVEAIAQELQYQREREESHRNVNENTNTRVQWFSVLTIVIVVGQSILGTWHLYSFFKKRKVL